MNAEARPGSEKRPRTVQSVEHAADILQALGAESGPLGTSELARKTGLSKTSVHHLLATMEARRLVMRDGPSAKFRLGWALYELGTSVSRSVDLARIARPYLDRLAVQTRESVLLGILHDDSVLYLDRGEPPQGLRMTANAGRRGPLHATASGKVLLAFCRDPVISDRVLTTALPRYTPTTVIDPEMLRQQLAEVRSNGYAVCWQEREVGLCSVAVGLRDFTGSVVGSLAIAGPASRLTSSSLHEHLPPLQAARQKIEHQLGAQQDRAVHDFD